MLFILRILAAAGSFFVWRSLSRRAQQRSLTGLLAKLAAFAAGMFAALGLLECFTIIPAGNVGVVDFFGTVSDKPLSPRINPTNPFARVIKFSTQTQEHKKTMRVLSRKGLTIVLN